jgi:hypothetical protein
MESDAVDRMILTTRLQGDAIGIEIQGNGTPPALQELGGNLGLQLCTSILEKQGNPLFIENPPEGGSRYTISLPIRKESA